MTTTYQKLRNMGVTDEFIAGYLVLVDDGYPPARAVAFLENVQQLGRDPFDAAKGFIELRQTAMRRQQLEKTE